MHNIKDIRNNFEDFKNSIKHRNIDINLDEIVELDKKIEILFMIKKN